METFCLDDWMFTCWMCFNGNYTEEHKGHNVVPLPEAYRLLKSECDSNAELIKQIWKVVFKRV